MKLDLNHHLIDFSDPNSWNPKSIVTTKLIKTISINKFEFDQKRLKIDRKWLILIKKVKIYWLFDCCIQSLIRLYHPPIHPPIQCHTFYGVDTKFLLHKFQKAIFGRADTNNANAQNFQLQTFHSKYSKFLTSNFTFLIRLFSTFWNNQNLIFIYKIDPR